MAPRGNPQSGRGRGGSYSSRGHQKPSPAGGGGRGGHHATNHNTRDYGQNAPTFQPRPFGSLARKNNPFLRAISFIKGDQVLFEEEDEIFMPEIVDVDFENTDEAALTADLVEEIFNPALGDSESSSSSDSESDEEDDADDDPSLRSPEDDVSAQDKATAELKVAETPAELVSFPAPIEHVVQSEAAPPVIKPLTKAERKRQKAEALRLAQGQPNAGKKGKGKKVKTQPNLSMVSKEDQAIRKFIKDPGRSTFQLSSMSKQKRKLVNILADLYHLGSNTAKGKKRLITLTRTKKTKLVDIKAYKAPPGPSKTGGQVGGKKDDGKHFHREGEVIGQHAAKITEENVGYRLLQTMGWSEGDRMGVTASGLEAPLEVVVKMTRLGIGAPMARKKT